MRTSRLGSVLWLFRPTGRMVLAAALLTMWGLPSHGATPTEAPPSTQADSAQDLPLELPAPADSGTQDSATDSPVSERTLFEEIPLGLRGCQIRPESP